MQIISSLENLTHTKVIYPNFYKQLKKMFFGSPKPFGKTKNGLVSGRLACTSSNPEFSTWFRIFFTHKTWKITMTTYDSNHCLIFYFVCATIDSQCLEYLVYITLGYTALTTVCTICSALYLPKNFPNHKCNSLMWTQKILLGLVWQF